jgi:hypothetical protein
MFGTDRLDEADLIDDDAAEDQLLEMEPHEQRSYYYDKMKEVFEPGQIDSAFLTKNDEKIRATDIPERLQLRYAKRSIPLVVFDPLSLANV